MAPRKAPSLGPSSLRARFTRSVRLARLVRLVLAALLLHGGALARADVSTERVAMRDGTRLATDVALPDGEGPWPAVLSRTPYGRKGLRGMAPAFVAAGYAFVAQDSRGRHDSEGEYDPFRTDHVDGYDAVEWVAARPWCSGRVGMVGGSALGICANLAMTQEPPHLRCAYVVVASSSARRVTVYQGGVYRKELNDGWLTLQGAAARIPEILSHPPGDAYWDWREIPAFHHRISIPVLHVGGWYDIFSQGTLDNFTGLQRRGRGLAAGNQRLVMGPWAHGPMGGRSAYPGADAGRWLGAAEQIRWMDRWLKGEPRDADREPPVRYYVLGDRIDPEAPGNEWRSAASWPPPSRPVSWFLRSGRRLDREPAPPAGGATDARAETSIAYTYDPARPVPTQGGHNLILGGRGPLDQRVVADRQDYIRFRSAPLPAPLEVAGRVTVDLWIESDAPDTDFVARLVDEHPDGYEALILEGILRTRYREGLDREVPLRKGEVAPIRIDLWSTAIVFNRGHRIALHLTSSSDPRFDPNPNTGKPTRADDEMRPARNTIHFRADRPSRLLLPVVEAAGSPAASGGSSPARPARSG